MKTYNYKGFKFYKGKNSYFVGNKEDGQIAPNDNVAPQTVKECKAVINSWLKVPKKETELKRKLEGFSLEEIADAYERFNPEFFNGYYDIPTTRDGWMEQISEDINGNGYSFEDIFCKNQM